MIKPIFIDLNLVLKSIFIDLNLNLLSSSAPNISFTEQRAEVQSQTTLHFDENKQSINKALYTCNVSVEWLHSIVESDNYSSPLP